MCKNILITGAGGFVGRNLREYLDNKYNIFATTRKDLDLLSQEAVTEYIVKNNIETVIHCANVGGSRKNGYDQGSVDTASANIRMFFNILSAVKPGMRLLHFGSGAEYEKKRDLHKVKVDDFGYKIPSDEYGFSKYVISKYIENTDDVYCFRIFGLYGKYEDYSYKFISNAIIKNILGLPIVINQNVIFDYLFIDDLLKITEDFINKPLFSRFVNITPSQSIDLISIAKIINKVSGRQSEIIVLNDKLNYEYTGDNRELLNNFDNYDFISYEEGISRLYNYYLSIIDCINTERIKEDPYLKKCSTNK
jgi:NAD dependent epimerase/dehydratase family.